MQITNFNKSYTKKLYDFIKNSKAHGYIDWVFQYNYFKNYVNESSENIILIFSDLSFETMSGYCLVENKETLGFTQLNFSLMDTLCNSEMVYPNSSHSRSSIWANTFASLRL